MRRLSASLVQTNMLPARPPARANVKDGMTRRKLPAATERRRARHAQATHGDVKVSSGALMALSGATAHGLTLVVRRRRKTTGVQAYRRFAASPHWGHCRPAACSCFERWVSGRSSSSSPWAASSAAPRGLWPHHRQLHLPRCMFLEMGTAYRSSLVACRCLAMRVVVSSVAAAAVEPSFHSSATWSTLRVLSAVVALMAAVPRLAGMAATVVVEATRDPAWPGPVSPHERHSSSRIGNGRSRQCSSSSCTRITQPSLGSSHSNSWL